MILLHLPLRIGRGLVVTTLVMALAVVSLASAAAARLPQTSTDQLDRLVAPVALYPDQLLAQMLLCAANPAKLSALDEYLRSHGSLQGTELQDAATAAGFDPSFVALAVFPDVVSTMAADPKWTAALGEAFTADKSAVFASIQRLRAQAKSAGSLKSTPQQTVDSRTTASGQQVIVIEPSNPQVVYVPQYNPQTVYAGPTTVVVQEDDDDDGAAIAAGVIGFTAGIAIGAAIDNDYYYGPSGWGRGVYMYDDAWDDWYDDREDAREDWMDHREDAREDVLDHREDMAEQRGERTGDAQQQRTERQQTRTTDQGRATPDRSGTKSDAFSGYSSGKSERAASQRGQKSRSSNRGGGRRR